MTLLQASVPVHVTLAASVQLTKQKPSPTNSGVKPIIKSPNIKSSPLRKMASQRVLMADHVLEKKKTVSSFSGNLMSPLKQESIRKKDIIANVIPSPGS